MKNELEQKVQISMHIGYPSSDFPGPPAVVLPLPEGWEGVHLPDTAIAVRQRGAERFAPNVVVRIHKHVGHTSEQLFNLLTESTRRSELSRTEMFDHSPAGLHRTLPGQADGLEIEQQQLLIIPDSIVSVVRYVVSIVGSSAVGDTEMRTLISEVLRGSRVTPAS